MTITTIHRAFSPVKRALPSWAYNPIRSIATVVIGPARFGYRSGYFRSAFERAAVSRFGTPLPWYTYPAIDFLKHRSYQDRTVLEFGGGHSTLWWAERASRVVTLEGDQDWHDQLARKLPRNAELHHVSMKCEAANVGDVRQSLEECGVDRFDVVVIDGLYRKAMVDIAIERVADDGIIICDNAEGFGFQESFKDKGLNRVDFFGNAPGVVLPHATSIFFGPRAFVFDPAYPIPVIAHE